jgi:hypothetical protein
VGTERVDERRRVGTELRGREALLLERQSPVQRAQLEGERSGIDAGDARPVLSRRAQAIPFAIS